MEVFNNPILITGYSGFIGNNLVHHLQSNNYTNLSFLGRTTQPNWNQLSNVDDYKTIIHLSGLAHDLKKTSTEKDYFDANFELTKKLFDLFLLAESTDTFIFVSTVAVKNKVETIFVEEDSTNPETFYGKSKLKAEEYILSNLPLNKKVLILRPTMVYGIGNKGNLNLLYAFVKNGIPYPLGAFNNERSFLYVENFCFIIKEIIENKNIDSGIYHLADDDTMSTQQLIKLIGTSLDKKNSILKVPKIMITFIAKIGNILPLPINSERLEKMTENFIVSNNKIKKSINKNLPFTSIEGWNKTLASFKK